MGTLFFKCSLNLLWYCLCFILFFVLFFFWPWSMWDLSSLTRDWTCTLSIVKQSLNHWTAREVPEFAILYNSVGLDQCLTSLIHHSSIIENDFTALKMSCAPLVRSSPLSTKPLATSLPFAFCVLLPFPKGHISGFMQHITFSEWFL